MNVLKTYAYFWYKTRYVILADIVDNNNLDKFQESEKNGCSFEIYSDFQSKQH